MVKGLAHIVETELQEGLIYGTIYQRTGIKPEKAVLIAHGFTGARHAFGTFARRLADAGNYTLSIDLPSHYKNPHQLTMGNLSQTINTGVNLLRSLNSNRFVAVIGHSMGATGAYFSQMGLSADLERKIGQEEDMRLAPLLHAYENEQLPEPADCYVYLAMPQRCNKVVPCLDFLKNRSDGTLRFIMQHILHPLALRSTRTEVEPARLPDDSAYYANMQYFHTDTPKRFLQYLSRMIEPVDVIRRLQGRTAANPSANRYRAERILAPPKIFVQGEHDLVVRPKKNKKELEKFCVESGNHAYYTGPFSHLMNERGKQHIGFEVCKRKEVSDRVISFLTKCL